jgi:glycosyltransferase involved in cell wall biosynthesis
LNIHIVHTSDFYTNVFGMAGAWLARVPVRIASRRETAGMRTRAQNWVERWAFRAAAAVVANADSVRDLLIEQGVSCQKIITIHNGVDLDRLALAPGLTASEIRRAFALPEECSRLVTIVANLRHSVKDLPTFLRAARRVRDALPDTAFVVAGEGDLIGHMRALAAELGLDGAVVFVGRCEKIAELLAISDVCALSSLAEGFSNSILEYMAAARPVVATDVGGAREAVEHGHTGYLVRAGDDEALATHIVSLLRNPSLARSMGARGRLVVEQRFSCEAQLDRTQRQYGRLLAARGQGRQGINVLSEKAVSQAANEGNSEQTGAAILEGNHGSL